MKAELELAWCAGFYDGEGCTFVDAGNVIGVMISQVDRRTLDRFRAATGIGTVYGPYEKKNPNEQPYYVFRARRHKAEQVISKLWPMLSEPKREQIEHILSKVKNSNPLLVEESTLESIVEPTFSIASWLDSK